MGPRESWSRKLGLFSHSSAPHHLVLTQQVLSYAMPAGGLALSWALGLVLQSPQLPLFYKLPSRSGNR